jgi:hypothetical protein
MLGRERIQASADSVDHALHILTASSHLTKKRVHLATFGEISYRFTRVVIDRFV